MIETKDYKRFYSKIDIGSDNDCWNWLGSLNNKKYGQFSIKNKKYLVTRISYFIANGMINNNLEVCHDT